MNLRSLGAPVSFGLALSLALLSILLFALWRDHEEKLAAAEDRVAALALGSDRLLDLEMRTLERALDGIALESIQLSAGAPVNVDVLRRELVHRVDLRHDELRDIALVDASGTVLDGGGIGDATISRWTQDSRNRAKLGRLLVGPPGQAADGEWVMPLAVPVSTSADGKHGWVLARLRLPALEQLVEGLDTGRDGVANIFHLSGRMVARSPTLARGLGGDFSGSKLMGQMLAQSQPEVADLVSPLDRKRRLIAYRSLEHYPFAVSVGVSREEVLGTWYGFAIAAALVCVVYGLGWLLLVRTLVRVNRRQSLLLDELGASQETLLDAQRIARLGSYQIDLATNVVKFSPEARLIFGFEAGDDRLTLQACLDRVHDEDRAALALAHERNVREEHVPDTPFRVSRPDGTVRSVIARGRVLSSEGRRVIVGTVHDVTELAESHLKLQEAEAQYRLLFEQNPLPFWVFHRETFRILEVNRAAVAEYGYSRDEFRAMGLADIRPAEDVEEALRAASQDDPETRRGRVWRHVRKDGSIFHVAVHASDISFLGQPARLVLAMDVTQRLHDQAQVAASERRFQLVARATNDAIFDWDMVSGALWLGESFDALFKYQPGEMPHTIAAWEERIHPEDRLRVGASLSRAADSDAIEWQSSYRFRRGDGSYAFVSDRGRFQRDPTGKAVRMVGGMMDVTRQHDDESELRLLRRAIESTGDGITIVDAIAPDMPMVYVNTAFERITGYSQAEALGRNCRFLQNGDHAQEGLETVRNAIAAKQDTQIRLRNYKKSGELFYNQLSLAPVRDEAGALTHFVGVITDITERQRYQDQLAYQASHDDLTGLLNRSALLAALEPLMVESNALPVRILQLDINSFKLINDSLGHEVGDAVLREVAQRLSLVAGAADRIARVGSNEFAVVLGPGISRKASDDLIARCLELLAQPIEALSTLHYLNINAGTARYPDHGRYPDLLLKNAGLATHEAKRRGHNQLIEFTSEFARAVTDRQLLVSRLHEAMDRGEFELFFQPVFNALVQEPVGMEALIRWRHPERGLVAPAEFIPVCEESGLIVPLGRWVLREACRHHRTLVDAGWGHLTIAVNVSAVQFLSGELQRDVPALLREFKVPHGVLELELTESLVMENPESVIEVMRELRQYGVLLSIDDFGTGYSSMSYLHRLPVDKLKIDRSFVTNVETDSHNAAICDSILALARSFDLKVIAEGVETPAQLSWLCGRACDEVQGYLLARPLPYLETVAALDLRRAAEPVSTR